MSIDLGTVAVWDPGRAGRAAWRLFALADDLEAAYEGLHRVAGRLAGWTGASAVQARSRVQVVATVASRLAARVRQAADAVRVDLPGLVEAVRLASHPVQSLAGLDQALALAAAVDRRVAVGLAAAAADPDIAWSGPEAAPLPPAGGDAREAARWWTGLPPHLRRRVVAEQASAMAALAGVPAAVRDAANRVVLARLLGLLRGQRDRLVGRLTTDAVDVQQRALISARLRVAEELERQLARLDRDGPVARLLLLDLEGSGRVAIGIGDLDRARHVAVLVPGMRRYAGPGLRRTLDEARSLHGAAVAESAQPTAVIAWIGYAAPGFLQAPFAHRARAGGGILAADLRGLAASRTAGGGEPAHVTVVGHSYGSTVVGAAAAASLLPADDVVLLGSPGALVERAADLGLGAGHVYAGEAPLDPVADTAVLGRDPCDPEFGAVVIASEPPPDVGWAERLIGGDHSHYLDPGAESLRNVARVVVGQGAQVTAPGGD